MKRAAAIALVALIIFAAIAIILTYPLTAHMSSNYFNPGISHDGVGTIAQTWYANYGRDHDLNKGNITYFFAYPFGYDLKTVSYPLTNGVLDALGGVIGAQASYNLLTLVSFPIAGLLMFLLVYYLTSSVAASFLSGFIYAFSPWHTARSFDQVGLAQVYVLPLFLIAVVYLWRRRSITSALAVAGAMLVAILTDFHFGLFCGLILICWGAGALISERVNSGRALKLRRPLVKRETLRLIGLAAMAVLLAAVLSAPFLVGLFYKDPMVTAETGERSIEVTASYSSRPWNYVVPPAYALIWRGWTNKFVAQHQGQSGTHEVTAYPGIVTYCLAFLAVFLTFRRRKRPSDEPASGDDAQPNEDCGPDHYRAGEESGSMSDKADLARTAVCFGLVTAVVAFILSMPPIVHIGSATIPTPSIVMRAIAPFFRFYSRWALVVTFALALMAGMGLFFLLRAKQLKGWKAAAVCLALIALFAIDVTIIPPLRSRDITDVPLVVTALEKQPKSEPVVFYPLSPGRYFIPLWYHYYQMFHEHPMLNGSKPGTEGDLYQGLLKDVYAPYTPAMLKGLGIKKVAVLNAYFKIMAPVGLKFDPSQMPAGYRLDKKTRDGYLFDVVGPAAEVFPLYYINFTPPVILEDGKAWSAMLKPRADLQVQNKGGPATRDFQVSFNNPAGEGTISLVLDGKSIGKIRVARGDGDLKVPAVRLTGEKQVLSLEWDGPPTQTSGKPFGLSGDIDLYLLLSRPQFSL